MSKDKGGKKEVKKPKQKKASKAPNTGTSDSSKPAVNK